MLITQTVEYALRAAVWLADQQASRTTQQIAEATQVPPSYLSKVLQGLARAGIVQGQRGLGGGFTLARSPAKITILEVVEAVEPIGRIERCPLGIPSHVRLCPLHRKLDDALAHVARAFASTTLADLIAPGTQIKPLCPVA
jgi:Rrf2 family transcriptional regulator, nitric oxide-sensitive transcriptional repressor